MCGFGWGPHTGIIVSSSQNITYTVPAREQIYTDGKYASNPPQLIRLNVFVRKLQSQPENRYIQTANSQIRIKSPTTREVKCISQKTTVPARQQIYTDGKCASNHPQPVRLITCISQKTIQSKPENRYRQQMRLKSPTTDEVKCISQKTTVPVREQIQTANAPQITHN